MREHREKQRWTGDMKRKRTGRFKDRSHEAIRMFPKFLTASLLPAQLQNYPRMMETYRMNDRMKMARLL